MKLIKVTSLLSLLALMGCLEQAKDAVSDVSDAIDDIKSEIESKQTSLDSLKEIIPEDLAIASTVEAVEDAAYSAKVQNIKSVFELDSALDSTDLNVGICVKVLKKAMNGSNKNERHNPECFGPTVRYDVEKHPDAQNMQGDAHQNGLAIGPDGYGSLPSGDLGLWEATDGSGEACAATKLNQLTNNATFYVDLASATMAMMACMAGMEDKGLPADGGNVDLSSAFAKLPDESAVKATKATIEKSGSGFKTTFDGSIKGHEFDITLKHIPSQKAGILSVKIKRDTDRTERQHQAVSVKYKKDDSGLIYRFVSAHYSSRNQNYMEMWENAFDAAGEVKSKTTEWSENYRIIHSKIDDEGKGDIAYGWQAGNGDRYLRVFNIHTNETDGVAYFGYRKNQNKSAEYGEENLSIDNIICNWAGPGNQKEGGPDILQRQKIKKGGDGVWVPEKNNIAYWPTNSCDVDDTGREAFPDINHESNANDLIDILEYDFEVPQI